MVLWIEPNWFEKSGVCISTQIQYFCELPFQLLERIGMGCEIIFCMLFRLLFDKMKDLWLCQNFVLQRLGSLRIINK